jgi:hypothetical protein
MSGTITGIKPNKNEVSEQEWKEKKQNQREEREGVT